MPAHIVIRRPSARYLGQNPSDPSPHHIVAVVVRGTVDDGRLPIEAAANASLCMAAPGPSFACRGLCQAPARHSVVSSHARAVACRSVRLRTGEVHLACTRLHAENCAVCGVTLPIRPERQAVHRVTGCRRSGPPSDLFPVGKRDLDQSQQAQPGGIPSFFPSFSSREPLSLPPKTHLSSQTGPQEDAARPCRRHLPNLSISRCRRVVTWVGGGGTHVSRRVRRGGVLGVVSPVPSTSPLTSWVGTAWAG